MPQKQRNDGKKRLIHSKQRYKSAKRMISALIKYDKDREDILRGVCDMFGYSELSARNVYEKVLSEIEEQYQRRIGKIADTNIKRLDGIIDEALDNDDKANAIKAIDLQNKTANVYQTNVNANLDTKKEFKIKVEK